MNVYSRLVLAVPDRISALSVRPRRRADPDGEAARGRVEADVRRLHAPTRGQTGADLRAFDASARTTTRASTASFAPTACGRFSRRAVSNCPEGSPDDPAGVDSVHGLGRPQERPGASTLIRRQGVEVYEGSVRFVEAARDARAAVARSFRRARTAAQVAPRRRASRTSSRCASTVSSPSEKGLVGKPAPDMFLAAARALERRADARGRVRGCARRCAGRPRPARSAGSWASTARVRRMRCATHGADIVVVTSPSCWRQR